jgi:hypothetical protein
LPGAVLDRLERRYFALRETLPSEPTDAEARAFLEQIVALEREVGSAGGRGAAREE